MLMTVVCFIKNCLPFFPQISLFFIQISCRFSHYDRTVCFYKALSTNTIEGKTEGYYCAQHHLDCSATATICFSQSKKKRKKKSLQSHIFFCSCVWSNRRNQVRWNDSSGVSVIDRNVVMIRSLKAQLVQ